LAHAGARYSQEKSARLSERANNVKEKMHDQRTCLFSRIFAQETYE